MSGAVCMNGGSMSEGYRNTNGNGRESVKKVINEERDSRKYCGSFPVMNHNNERIVMLEYRVFSAYEI